MFTVASHGGLTISQADAANNAIKLTRTDSPQSWGIGLGSNDFNISDLTHTGSPIYLYSRNASGGLGINVNSGGDLLSMARLDTGQRWIVHFAGNDFTIREGEDDVGPNNNNWFTITSGVTGRVNIGKASAGSVTDLSAKLGVEQHAETLAVLRLRGAASQSGPMLSMQDSAGAELAQFNSSGKLMVGTTTATGSGASDLVTKNTGAFRFIRAGVATSANYGIVSDAGDGMGLQVPTAASIFRFSFAGTSLFDLVRENAGAGLKFLSESSADHTAPSSNQCVLYTRDDGAGKTELVARFATGAVQVVAAEP